jgi:hypothetical protein
MAPLITDIFWPIPGCSGIRILKPYQAPTPKLAQKRGHRHLGLTRSQGIARGECRRHIPHRGPAVHQLPGRAAHRVQFQGFERGPAVPQPHTLKHPAKAGRTVTG